MEKKQARLRRARKTRAKIAELKVVRLAVHRSNQHISAQIFSGCGTRVLAMASTMEPTVRSQVPNGGNVEAAKTIDSLRHGRGGRVVPQTVYLAQRWYKRRTNSSLLSGYRFASDSAVLSMC